MSFTRKIVIAPLCADATDCHGGDWLDPTTNEATTVKILHANSDELGESRSFLPLKGVALHLEAVSAGSMQTG